MATINFLIQTQNSPASIYVRLREGRALDAKVKTNFVIDPKEWSNKKGQPKTLKDDALKRLNADLVTFRKKLTDHYNKSVGSVSINSDWLKEFINPPKKAGEVPTRLTDHIGHYTEVKRNEVGSSTYKRNNVYKALIERFEKHSKKTYYIWDVNLDFKHKFETYCFGEGYAPNTVARTVKFIKTICYHARINGIETHFQLDSITTKLQKVEKVYLNLDELQKIDEVNLDADYLVNARDWLIISCETGQRVSDFMRFDKEHIRIEKDKHLIEFRQVKTGKLMTVPLSKKVLRILKKRKGNFPRVISDQKYNEYIKEVCRLAGITNRIKGSKIDPKTNRKVKGTFEKWELVSSHIGRRSFATNNYGSIPTSLLIGATGHSTESMFLEYIGKSNSEKAIQLADFIN